jgi:hypothetical protein
LPGVAIESVVTKGLMKKVHRKPLALATETIRALRQRELRALVGGAHSDVCTYTICVDACPTKARPG